MPLAPVVLFSALILVIAVVVVLAVSSDRKKSRARAEAAALRGWSYTAGGGGRRHYLLEGQCEGGAWQVEARRGGKNNPGHTSFKCQGAAAGGGVVYVGPPGLAKILQSGIGRTVTQWGLRLGSIVGADTEPMRRLLENPMPLDADGTAFGERFSALTTDTSLAHKVLTPTVKEALLGWQPKGRWGAQRARGLQATWCDEGLSLDWHSDVQEPDDMVSFAELGATLVKESRGGSW